MIFDSMLGRWTVLRCVGIGAMHESLTVAVVVGWDVGV